MTTRYSGQTNSKSVNARIAECEGRFPASGMVKLLRSKKLFRGVTAADILGAVDTHEWHHVGSYAQRVNYYGIEDIFRHRKELRTAISARRAQGVSAGAVVYPDCTVEWLEWRGTRNHPRAVRCHAEHVGVTVKGQFITIHLANGDLRKKLGANGLVLRVPNGGVL